MQTAAEKFFSACNWGVDNVEEWIKTTGAYMWRSTPDINDTWESVKKLAMRQFPLQKFNGQGCFNNIDMLPVGMNGAGKVAIYVQAMLEVHDCKIYRAKVVDIND